EVRLAESGKLDSAGMLIAADGSSRQRGHEEAPDLYADRTDALFPSGSAALYRRKMETSSYLSLPWGTSP
ncbi:MAG TPA: hypothetical protein VOA88_10805, partial [Candidatus Dormibacteraeota bacterium]|nr:hypothetical protein [Candidatus Dormibacteraeota bacterium]